MFNYCVEIEAL